MRIAWLLALAACSSSPASSGDGGTDGGGVDGALTDGNGSGDGNPNNMDGSGSDGGPSCLPAGYTLMPFLTQTASTHTFAMATQVLDTTHMYVGVLVTDQGCVAMQLNTQVAPISSNSFAFLTLNHFYDGVAFHRVIPGFVAQGGDPNTISGSRTTWGTGGPGYSFGLEVNSSVNYTGAGVVGMARSQSPDSNGSQFFITYAAQPSLNQMYTIWAEVISGMDAVNAFAVDQNAGTPSDSPPLTPTRILTAYIGMM